MPNYDKLTLEEILRTLNKGGNSVRSGGGSGYGGGYIGVSGTSFGLVANRTQIATTTATIAANATFRRQHHSHPDGDITNIQAVYCSWYYNTSFVDTNAPSSFTFKSSIEYPAGVIHRFSFNAVGGSDTLTLAPGVTQRKSDVLLSSVTGQPLVIPKGTKFWERTTKTNASSTLIMQALPAGATVIGVDDGFDATDKVDGGSMPATSGANSFGAIAFEGNIAAANARSFAICGDSLPFGTGDDTSCGALGGSGWLARALDVRGYPYMKLCRGSQQAAEFAGGAKSTSVLANVAYSDAILTHALNDLSLGSRTLAQVLADRTTIRGMIPNGRNIITVTMNPRSTSTDSWATTANQTAATDGNMADYQNLQNAIRAKESGVLKVIELADQCMPSRDANIWTAPPAATADGVHPNSIKCAAMAAALASSI